MSLQPGMLVYAPDQEALWVKATIKKITSKNHCMITVHESQKCVESPISELLPCSEQAVLDIHNLTELSPINRASVILCLDERYLADIYYTNAGSTIVAINPFRDVSQLYSNDMIFDYHAEQKEEPHIYQIGCQAYKTMCQELGNINQTVIVSGESGSGKTVSAKHLLRYMTMISNSSRDENSDRHSPQGQCVERRLLDSNPILEAFGNAVTQRNNNSSRFGKFIKLQFSRNGQMVGGQIQTYLLEKTRVVHQSTGECNFHIFYQLLKSIRESPDTSLCQVIEEIGQDGMKCVPEGKVIENNRDLTETLDAMTEIGLTQDIQDSIMKVLVSILFLCNMELTPLDEELCKLVSDKEDQYLDTTFVELEVTQLSLEQASDLLGIQPSNIEQALLYRNITSGGNARRSIFIKPVPQREAYSRRDCLTTVLYSRLFDWLVGFINSQIEADNYNSTIGLLDIYGFEAFETNSLEQLCINYANEKLQQHYVQHFMKDLQREYQDECIDWKTLDYTDNKPCLDILEGQPSVFGLLNEEVQLNRKTDTQQLCERILQLSHQAKYYVIKPKTFMKCPAFTIHHYAGNVTYKGDGLATKNRDNIPQELIELLQNSTNQFVSELFADYQLDSSSGRKRKTVLGKFKGSLDTLLHSLHTSDVHYIRCIKPNTTFQPGLFDRHYVMEQLIAGGIVETIEISSHGYPVRMPYGEFLQRYGIILRNSHTPDNTQCIENKDTDMLYEPLDLLYKKQLEMIPTRKSTTPRKRLRRRAGLSSADHARRCSAAVLKLHFENCDGFTKQFGKTKLFMYQNQVDSLERRRLEILNNAASIIQRLWRQYVYRQTCKRKCQEKQAAIKIQASWRGYVRSKQVKAVVLLQKNFRMHSARQKFKAMKEKLREKSKTKKRSWRTIIDRSGSSKASSRRSTRSSGRRSDTSTDSLSQLWTSSASNSSANVSKSDSSMETFVPSSGFITSTPRDSGERKGSVENVMKVMEPDTDKQLETDRNLEIGGQGDVAEKCEMVKKFQTEEKHEIDENLKKDKKLQTSKNFQRMVKGRPNFVSENPKNYIKYVTRSSTQALARVPFAVKENETTSLTDAPPVKKQKTEDGYKITQYDVNFGDGIITRRHLPKVPIKFHTRPSVLKNAHFINKRELACGLEDCKPDVQSKETGDQTTEDQSIY